MSNAIQHTISALAGAAIGVGATLIVVQARSAMETVSLSPQSAASYDESRRTTGSSTAIGTPGGPGGGGMQGGMRGGMGGGMPGGAGGGPGGPGAGAGGPGGGFTPPENGAAWIKQNDKDGDGKVTKDELNEFAQQFFSTMDPNGDGFVDAAEAEAVVQRMRARTQGGGGGAGMAGGPGTATSPARNLTALVAKLDLLGRGVRIELSADQANQLAPILEQLSESEEMTDEQAKEQLESIEAVLTEEQKASLASVELPRGRLPGGGPGTGGGRGTGMGMAGGGMAAGSGAPNNQNPFRQELNQKRLADLLRQLGKAEH